MNRLADRRTTVLLFGLVILMFAVMQAVFPRTLAAPLPDARVQSPVLLFEFARTPEHLDHVFGAPGDPERPARIAAMDRGNRLDFLFMPLYGFFVFSVFAGIARERKRRVWLAVGALGLVAAASDAVENVLLLEITADLPSPGDALACLPWPVWIKFGLLALTCGAAAVALFRSGRRVLGALCLPAPLAILPGIAMPLQFGSLAVAMIGLGWLAMGLDAVTRLRRKTTG
ncbi:hypothetical protein [Sphingosinicella microcystinivorans]|uniref:hypothetical protein n=1 Tax=Sphingosinicella microcystinivorans TaxID=335406 RepID=UPI0022F3A15F|nr:hypothetical protein [Sphingosinicella microcystinivorans]WBX83350.1 hypothetical protein PE061_16345 [Sphingosinicella microcystinivorans]